MAKTNVEQNFARQFFPQLDKEFLAYTFSPWHFSKNAQHFILCIFG